jgi:hypothetical protein
MGGAAELKLTEALRECISLFSDARIFLAVRFISSIETTGEGFLWDS